MSIVTTNMK